MVAGGVSKAFSSEALEGKVMEGLDCCVAVWYEKRDSFESSSDFVTGSMGTSGVGGFLESASATTLVFPVLYCISYSYSESFSLHFHNLELGSLIECNQTSGLWSVSIVNFLPVYMYLRSQVFRLRCHIRLIVVRTQWSRSNRLLRNRTLWLPLINIKSYAT